MYSKIKRKQRSQFILVTSILPNHVPTHDLALNHHLKISDVAARFRIHSVHSAKSRLPPLRRSFTAHPGESSLRAGHSAGPLAGARSVSIYSIIPNSREGS